MFPRLQRLKCEERIDCLGIWTLEERRNRADLLHFFKMYKELSSTPFSHFFSTSSVTNTRGHTAKLMKSRFQLDIRRFFFSSYREMELFGSRSYWLQCCKFLQEQLRKDTKDKDGLFMDPPVRLAWWLHQLWTLVQVRLHLVISIHTSRKYCKSNIQHLLWATGIRYQERKPKVGDINSWGLENFLVQAVEPKTLRYSVKWQSGFPSLRICVPVGQAFLEPQNTGVQNCRA